MGEWKNMWVNLKIGPSEKDTYIRELLRHIDALKAELADIKKGDWVARVFDATDEIERLSADRDRWKALGQHVCEFHSSLIPQHIHDLFDDYNKAVRGE